MSSELEALRPYATKRQAEYLDAVIKHGGKQAAADALGVSRGTVLGAIQRLQRKRAKREPSAHALEAPEGYKLRGVSTLLGSNGEVRQQWVKTAPENDSRPEALLAAFREAVDSAELPEAEPIECGHSEHNSRRLAVYAMGDPHLGLYAHAPEAGENFDLDTACQLLVSAVDRLVNLAPFTEQALIINAGDFFHADNSENRTARSGHALDVDSRWCKVMQAGIHAMRRAVGMALRKHRRVTVFNAIGNHDDHTSLMLSLCLAEHYRGQPRVQIDTTPAPFRFLEFGNCLLGVTHGHSVKPEALPGIMATDQAEAWGRTRYRHWYTGHVHHESRKEFPGCSVETLRTLAARDAWAQAGGYRSRRTMICDVWDAEYGDILRHTVGVEQLRVESEVA